MSPWVRDSVDSWASAEESPTSSDSAAPEEDANHFSGVPPGAGRPSSVPRWFWVTPFFLSAVLFLSGLFSFFAPMPLLMVGLRGRRAWAWLAAATNLALVVGVSGTLSAGFYLVFVLALALTMPEFLRRRWTLEKTAGMTLLFMLLSAGVIFSVQGRVHHLSPLRELQEEVSSWLDFFTQNLTGDARTNLLGTLEPEEWKQEMLLEIPSAVAVFSLILVWLNLMLVLRLNPGKIRESMGLSAGYFRHWKAPVFLLWPTIGCGFLVLFEVGWPSVVALNVFKFLMAIYAIQGLSILSFFFDAWSLRGFLRSLGYVASIFLMMPLLLSLGFFDLWFDFRAKLRQS